MSIVISGADRTRQQHLSSALVRAKTDIEERQEHLPRAFVQHLEHVSQAFSKWMGQLEHFQQQRVAHTANCHTLTRKLSGMVRDIYIIARRKVDRGDMDAAILARHKIPRMADREGHTRADVWLQKTQQLLQGDSMHRVDHPSILREPTRAEIEPVYIAVRTAFNQMEKARKKVASLKEKIVAKRTEVDTLLRRMRYYLKADLMEKTTTDQEELLQRYGYRHKSPARKRQPLPMAQPTTKKAAAPQPVKPISKAPPKPQTSEPVQVAAKTAAKPDQTPKRAGLKPKPKPTSQSAKTTAKPEPILAQPSPASHRTTGKTVEDRMAEFERKMEQDGLETALTAKAKTEPIEETQPPKEKRVSPAMQKVLNQMEERRRRNASKPKKERKKRPKKGK